MKSFLRHRSPRFGMDGWALRVRGASRPIEWSVCTTREEARELRREKMGVLVPNNTEVVKVRITVEVIPEEGMP